MKQSVLQPFRLTVLERNLGMYGIHVYQEGQGEASWMWRSDDKVCLYSGSKTFTALGVGIALDAGRLKLEDRALDFFPEYRKVAASGSEAITVRDLLHMAGGKNVFLFTGGPERMLTHDWAELFFTDPQVVPAGSAFFYATACTYM